MKYLKTYKTLAIGNTADHVFNYLIETLSESIKYWDYFVDWNKVHKNLSGLEMELNLLNYLIGKEDVESEFKLLLREHPTVINLIPLLIACREKKFSILTGYSKDNFSYQRFSFKSKKKLSQEEINDAFTFAKESGVLEIFKNRTLKSVPDYVLGIEVGLDSNGRKSRGGKAMENILESFIAPVCSERGLDYAVQADSNKINARWKIKIKESDRKFDFVINNNGKIVIIETNYYGGGGTKLKATAGEYETLFDYAKVNGYEFIWITDGLGWNTAHVPLRKSFDKLDYIFNLKMVTSGALEEVLNNG